jgi:hypothetical protein
MSMWAKPAMDGWSHRASIASLSSPGGVMSTGWLRDLAAEQDDVRASLPVDLNVMDAAATCPEMAVLLADTIDALETANYWDEIDQCVRCVSCDSNTDLHDEGCEIAPLLARFAALQPKEPA